MPIPMKEENAQFPPGMTHLDCGRSANKTAASGATRLAFSRPCISSSSLWRAVKFNDYVPNAESKIKGSGYCLHYSQITKSRIRSIILHEVSVMESMLC